MQRIVKDVGRPARPYNGRGKIFAAVDSVDALPLRSLQSQNANFS